MQGAASVTHDVSRAAESRNSEPPKCTFSFRYLPEAKREIQQQPATHLNSLKDMVAVHFLARVAYETRMVLFWDALTKETRQQHLVCDLSSQAS